MTGWHTALMLALSSTPSVAVLASSQVRTKRRLDGLRGASGERSFLGAPARWLALRRAVWETLPAPRRRLVVGAGAAALVAAAGPAGLVLAGGIAAGAVHRRRLAARTRQVELHRAIPDTIDLIALAIDGGMTVALAVRAVARVGPGPMAAALGRVAAAADRGERLADALDRVPGWLGESTRPLVVALASAERHGGPVLPTLHRLAVDARADNRRRAEEEARRMPVVLLFPLVACILPAFALLTVAPLIAGSLQQLHA